MSQIVTPLPAIGEVIPGQDVAGRSLRVSGHPESHRVVLSIWQDGRCLATVRVARTDIPDLTRALVSGLVPRSDDASGHAGPDATVHHLPTVPTVPATSTGFSTGLADRARTAVTGLLPRLFSDRFRRAPRD